jgi:hypothetical protein
MKIMSSATVGREIDDTFKVLRSREEGHRSFGQLRIFQHSVLHLRKHHPVDIVDLIVHASNGPRKPRVQVDMGVECGTHHLANHRDFAKKGRGLGREYEDDSGRHQYRQQGAEEHRPPNPLFMPPAEPPSE